MSQRLEVHLIGETVSIEILDHVSKIKLITELEGRVDSDLFKLWTRQSYLLRDGTILIEFYDLQAARVASRADYKKLKNVRFVKNYSWFLKKNISYQYEIDWPVDPKVYRNPIQLEFISERPEWYNYEVWQLENGNSLFIIDIHGRKRATVYNDMKTMASDPNATPNSGSEELIAQLYGGDEERSQRLLAGDPMLDFEPNHHLVYPQDVEQLISAHKLNLVAQQKYVDTFYGNLFRAEGGYYMLIDDQDQLSMTGAPLSILSVRVYEHLAQLDSAIAKYKLSHNLEYESNPFYQAISNQYGRNFSGSADSLIQSLPALLNFAPEQLTFDDQGMRIVDEAIRWNHEFENTFDAWFPAVLAYYGNCYNIMKESVHWGSTLDRDYNVYTPTLLNKSDKAVLDSNEFFKSLLEWPVSIRSAGRWNASQ